MKNIKFYTIAVCFSVVFAVPVTAQPSSWNMLKPVPELQADDNDTTDDIGDLCKELFPLCEAFIV